MAIRQDSKTVFSDAIALAARMDYFFNPETFVGLSAYGGNTAPNRPKEDLDVDAHVGILEGHFAYKKGALKLRGMGLYGVLQNADRVSKANRNLSNNLNVKRTPVADVAMGYYLEAAYDVLSFWESNHSLDIFGRYDYYDSMYKNIRRGVLTIQDGRGVLSQLA